MFIIMKRHNPFFWRKPYFSKEKQFQEKVDFVAELKMIQFKVYGLLLALSILL